MGMACVESQFHVLAVDDSIIDRKLIERLLKTSSYQVTTVDSGSKALKFLGLSEDEPDNKNNNLIISPNNNQEVEINLIITDYWMPGMTGYDLLKKVKESSSLRNIPVVIMSSENDPSRISRCLEEGAEEFLLKPVKMSDLNKLKPRIMETKTKNRKQENVEEDDENEDDEETKLHAQRNREETNSNSSNNNNNSSNSNNNNNNNKRKAMEEVISQDRTRPRYDNSIATLV